MRILVTHHVHFLSNASQILCLDNGEVKFLGSFVELFNPKAIDLDVLLLKNTRETSQNEDNLGNEKDCLITQITQKAHHNSGHNLSVGESKSIASSIQFLNVLNL
jgi:hypothetical protein